MSTKTLNTRIQTKVDTSVNWGKIPYFTPLSGEICVYSDLNRIKIGNGVTPISLLKFIDDDVFYVKENVYNKVTTLNAFSTDVQYPSAKCVYDLVGNIEALLEALL